MTTVTDVDASKITGNVSDDMKKIVRDIGRVFCHRSLERDFTSRTFGGPILNRMMVTEASVLAKAEEPEKLEARVVCELDVEEDMINGAGNIHGGCSAFLIDVCSSLALLVLKMSMRPDIRAAQSVSQSLNVVYHSPAALGDKIRLVNTTLSIGARAQSVRTEIWNVTHHRLVASGVHLKMQPSQPKARL